MFIVGESNWKLENMQKKRLNKVQQRATRLAGTEFPGPTISLRIVAFTSLLEAS